MSPQAQPQGARPAREVAALLTRAELLAASVAPEDRVTAARLLEDIRFDMARENAPAGHTGLPLAELRKLTPGCSAEPS